MIASRIKLLSLSHSIPALFLVVLLQYLAASVAFRSLAYSGNDTDRIALLAIKSQLVHDPEGILSSWNHSVHHCYWEGVTCGRKHKRVVSLILSSKDLGGTISPFIGNLSFLRTIWLGNNNLDGQMPPELGHLVRLQILGLHNNTLSGEIPANLSRCINLQKLSIGFNKIEGVLPAGLGTLLKLQHLYVHHNNFTGPLFKVIANITSLEKISAAYNGFTGSIPTRIGRMQKLTFFGVADNKLSGVFPSSLFNLSSLQILDCAYNQLHGKLPGDIGLTLPSLTWLSLEGNSFSGPLPISMSNFTALEFIGLGVNNFTGQVPHDLGKLQNLWQIHLDSNHLAGEINFISSLVNCTKLAFLVLGGNGFTGNLPTSIANLSTTLVDLETGDNPLTGAIPSGLTNLINLEFLYMRSNQLKGPLPHDFEKLQNLEWFDLGVNKLTGEIPNSFRNFSRLSRLFLDDNRLQGSIPPSLGNCQTLLYLNLSYNELDGTLPSELFSGSAKFINLTLSHNHLKGILPLEISKQTNLEKFGVSGNKLSGTIPDGLSECPDLQYLHMQDNLFHGIIPPSFKSLHSLLDVDLSHNNLSGPLPDYFSAFPLKYLNLAYNNFEGGVPTTGVFANTSSVYLAGNSKLCGGLPALHLPNCLHKARKKTKKKKISLTLMLTISITGALVGGIAIATGLYLIFMRKKRKPASSGSWTGEFLFKVSYNMLLKATNGFSSENLLGVGTLSSVFKGILDGKIVAIKILNLQSRGASSSFLAECKVLRNFRHRNLLRIVTACSSVDNQGNDFKALVYEYMPNGSLERWLHEPRNLSLLQRVDIAIDVAHALNYLHHEGEFRVVHCDLKPGNILLDSDMVAHVGDFGLAKFLTLPRHPNQSSSIGIRGTVGYAAPEYGLGNEVAPAGDIYSYGVLLLELMTGKRPTDDMFKEDINIHMYAEAATLPDKLRWIIDPTLQQDNEISEEVEDTNPTNSTLQQVEECMVSVINVGLACSKHLPQDRMKLTDVLSKLQAARDNLLNGRRSRNFPRETK